MGKTVEARVTTRWEPKTWKPRYDLIVYKHCLGYDNKKIAAEMMLCEQAVSNVLVSLQGRARIKIIQEKLLTNIDNDLASRLKNVAEKFMRKIERVADDEELFNKSPFAVIDRGIAIIKGVGHMRSSEGESGSRAPGFVNHGTMIGRANIVMPAESIEGLREAIQLSDEARELHENKPFQLISGSGSGSGAKVEVGVKQEKAS